MKVLASLAASLMLVGAAVASGADRYPCESVHTFDFWVGDFDATPWDQPAAPSRGQLHNTREYHGCVILERWVGKSGSGMSTAFYDTSLRAWRMVWVGDDGIANDMQGDYRDGAMRLTGWMLDDAGKRVKISNVLQPVSSDAIRHIFSVSSDGGKTWTVKSDGRFVRRK